MTAVCSSETMVNFYLIARHHTPEVRKCMQSVKNLAERVMRMKFVLLFSNNPSSKRASPRRSRRQKRPAECLLLLSCCNEKLNVLKKLLLFAEYNYNDQD